MIKTSHYMNKDKSFDKSMLETNLNKSVYKAFELN